MTQRMWEGGVPKQIGLEFTHAQSDVSNVFFTSTVIYVFMEKLAHFCYLEKKATDSESEATRGLQAMKKVVVNFSLA